MTFASEYELLCSEHSLLWSRIKLWAQSIGLDLDADNPQSNLNAPPDVQSTIVDGVANIIHLISEIDTIRQIYEFRPPLISGESQSDEKEPSVSVTALTNARAVRIVRERIRGNQKQKSCFTIAKWTICDARRFEEKVKQVKTLIDGLEDVAVAAGLTWSLSTRPRPSVHIVPNESPPPYSATSGLPRYRPSRNTTTSSLIPPQTALPALPALPIFDSTISNDPEIVAHYAAMMRHCGLASRAQDHPRWRARDKMTRLHDRQFKELRIDVYDELFRREMSGSTPPFLPPDIRYHLKRNLAREKLSTLAAHRFEDLVVDVLFEMERRFPSLQGRQEPGVSLRIMTSFSEPRQAQAPSSPEPRFPPPPLQDRPAHPTTLSPRRSGTIPISRFSQYTPDPSQTVDFQSFGINLHDPTSLVLPAALRRYKIQEPVWNFNLYVVYGDEERCLESDEKPLMVLRDLKRRGWKPLFLLRKRPAVQETEMGSAEAFERLCGNVGCVDDCFRV